MNGHGTHVHRQRGRASVTETVGADASGPRPPPDTAGDAPNISIMISVQTLLREITWAGGERDFPKPIFSSPCLCFADPQMWPAQVPSWNTEAHVSRGHWPQQLPSQECSEVRGSARDRADLKSSGFGVQWAAFSAHFLARLAYISWQIRGCLPVQSPLGTLCSSHQPDSPPGLVPSESFPRGPLPLPSTSCLGSTQSGLSCFCTDAPPPSTQGGRGELGILWEVVSHLPTAKRAQSALLGCGAGMTPHLTRGQRTSPDGSSSCSTFTESVCRTQGGGK